MMIGADHAALQDREEVFSGVGMRLTLAELAASVERVAVAGELAANGPVVASFVRHERRGAVHAGYANRADVVRGDIGKVEGGGAIVAEHKRNNLILRSGLAGRGE